MKPRLSLLLFLLAVCLARAWWILDGEVSGANALLYILSGAREAAMLDGPGAAPALVGVVAGLGGSWWMLLGVVWSAMAAVIAVRLGCRLGVPEREACLGGAALLCLPALNSAAFVSGPILPSLTLQLVGIVMVWNAAHGGRQALWWWAGAAAAWAMAASFEYAAVLSAVGAVVASLTLPAGRRPVGLVGAALVVAALLAALVPSWLWNVAHDWLPWRAWTPGGVLQFRPGDVVAGIAAYVMALSPFLALMLPLALRQARPSVQRFLLVCLAPAVALVMLQIYRGWCPSVLLPAAVLLPFCAMLLRPAWMLVATGIAAFFAIPAWQAAHPQPAVREAARALLALDERLASDLQGRLFFVAGTPELAAALDYHLRTSIIPIEGHPRVYLKESQADLSVYRLMPSYEQFVELAEGELEGGDGEGGQNPFVGHSAVYVGQEAPAELPQAIRGAFAEVQLVRELGQGEHRLYIYLCVDYQTLPL